MVVWNAGGVLPLMMSRILRNLAGNCPLGQAMCLGSMHYALLSILVSMLGTFDLVFLLLLGSASGQVVFLMV